MVYFHCRSAGRQVIGGRSASRTHQQLFCRQSLSRLGFRPWCGRLDSSQQNRGFKPQMFANYITSALRVKVLGPPAILFKSNQSQQIPACMEGESARNVEQFDPGFFRSPVSLFEVTLPAARHQVIPSPGPSPRLRQNMIEGKNHLGRFSFNDPCSTLFSSAVLAEISVPGIDIRPSQYRNPDRNLLVRPKPDNAR